jgi:hypothetical protein
MSSAELTSDARFTRGRSVRKIALAIGCIEQVPVGGRYIADFLAPALRVERLPSVTRNS